MTPFIVSDESLHIAGAGLKELDLINKHRYTLSELGAVIVKEFSCEHILCFNGCSFESLRPGKEVDYNVCDLCLKW